MSWGGYWFYYYCENCRIKFKKELAEINQLDFSICPKCHKEAIFKGETKNKPKDYDEYQEI